MMRQIDQERAGSRSADYFGPRGRSFTGLAVVLAALSLAAPVRAQSSASPQEHVNGTAAQPVTDDLKAGSVPVPPPPAQPPLPAIDPIIPDSEFNSAVPALDTTDDAELNKPLEIDRGVRSAACG
ncbi:hypothetical protein ACFSTD_08590 [Novosphingobium colocasiae]